MSETTPAPQSVAAAPAATPLVVNIQLDRKSVV